MRSIEWYVAVVVCCLQNLTALASAIPEIRMGPQI